MAPQRLGLAVVATLLLGIMCYTSIFFITQPIAATTAVAGERPPTSLRQQQQQPSVEVGLSATTRSADLPGAASSPVLPPSVSSRSSTSIFEQLRAVERSLPTDDVANFKFQASIPRSDAVRPHLVPFSESLTMFPLPVPDACPSSIRPDEFCAPNLGRDWSARSTVFPLSYSLPAELFPASIPPKDKDCASIVPRDRATYNFANEVAYIAEYARSYYCLTYKKGGWDVLRHYEIIAAGCMPYLPDLESCPVYTLYHLPKQLLLEARDLPGVAFDCAAVRVTIDHAVFPKARYMALMEELLAHSRQYLTTKAMAQYVLNATRKPSARRILYFAAAKKGVMLKAQGNYNSWTLFHGLRTLLGPSVVDPFPIPFLYQQPAAAVAAEKRQLYGFGFGYAYKLPNLSDVDRENVVDRIAKREFDLIIFADPTAMSVKGGKGLKYLAHVKKHYTKEEIVFLHAPDIAYPLPSTIGYDVGSMYDDGTVFQREIMDCAFYAPVVPGGAAAVGGGGASLAADGRLTRGEAMKRCVWYHNKNCLDDVNVQLTLQRKGLAAYPWAWPTVRRIANGTAGR